MNPLLQTRDRPRWLWFGLAGAALAVGGALLVRLWRRRRTRSTGTQVRPDAEVEQVTLQPIVGLTEEEVAQRQVAEPVEPQEDRDRKVQRIVVRRSVLSIFNLTMVAYAIALWLLGDSWGAVVAILILVFNITVKIVQQMVASKQIDAVAEKARPTAMVIRDGVTRHVDPVELVEGDVLAIAPGDLLLADGELITASTISMNRVGGDATIRFQGDRLSAGEECVRGWGAYRIEALDRQSLRTLGFHAISESTRRLTPIQRLMDHTLRALIILVIFFVTFLALQIAGVAVMTPWLQETYQQTASIIFSLAPSGLYFTVLVTYTLGAALLARNQALVRDTGLVEALAQTTVICFGKSGVLTQTQLHIDFVDVEELADATKALPANRIVQILGVFAHSLSSETSLSRLIATTYEGDSYRPISEIRADSSQGLLGISLEELAVRGTYLLADEQRLSNYLQQPTEIDADTVQEDESVSGAEGEVSGSLWKRTTSSVRHLFKRQSNDNGTEGEATDIVEQGPDDHKEDATENLSHPTASSSAEEIDAEEADRVEEEREETSSFVGRLRATRFAHSLNQRVLRITHRTDDEEPVEESEPQISEPSRTLFAYSPEPSQLVDEDGEVTIPQNLVPLCYLELTEGVRNGAEQVIKAFARSGVTTKILSSDRAEAVADLFASLDEDSEEALSQTPDDRPSAVFLSGETLERRFPGLAHH